MRDLINIIETWSYPEKRISVKDWDRILRAQRELEGIRAAIRDPLTGIIYTGWTHQSAMDKVPPTDETGAWGRLHVEWDESTDNVGFVSKDGEFISRTEAFDKWGVYTIEDIKDLRAKK